MRLTITLEYVYTEEQQPKCKTKAVLSFTNVITSNEYRYCYVLFIATSFPIQFTKTHNTL